MYAVYLLLMIIIGYLSGAINYAIVVTRLVSHQDIRTLGNLNPGTMNTYRSVGRGWGLLVGVLDGLKAFGPMLLARLFLFPGGTWPELLALSAIGIAAIVGHCRPVFYGFDGGKGAGSVLGAFIFLVPLEFFAAMLLGALIVLLFFRQVRYRWGRWVPIMFITLTPVLVTISSFTVDIPIFAHISAGGHPWPVIMGTWAISLSTFALNTTFMNNRVQEYKGSTR